MAAKNDQEMVVNYPVKTYKQSECAVFCRVADKFGGLSNMAGGYPLIINGTSIRFSEALYQAMRFANHPDIQREIIKQTSPMAAKMVTKPVLDQSREDWLDVRLPIMAWALKIKLIQNFIKFGTLLLSTGDMDIVELSVKDSFWGAKPQGNGTLVGQNVLGNLLTNLRNALINDPEALKIIQPPVDGMFLFGEPIPTIYLE